MKEQPYIHSQRKSHSQKQKNPQAGHQPLAKRFLHSFWPLVLLVRCFTQYSLCVLNRYLIPFSRIVVSQLLMHKLALDSRISANKFIATDRYIVLVRQRWRLHINAFQRTNKLRLYQHLAI